MSLTAFYLRLSVADGDIGRGKDESNSIENQRLLLRSFLEGRKEMGGEVREYVDDGYTGTNFNRPAFKRMIEDAKTGAIGMILVKDLSRLGRNYIEVGDYLEQIFPMLGIRFIAVNSHYDSDDYMGRTMGLEMSVTNLVNSLYSKDTSKKIKTGRAVKWKKGISTAGRAPFGYMRDRNSGGGLRPDPETAGYIRTIFAMAADGKGTTAIADFLNQNHIPTPGQYRKMRREKEYGTRRVYDEEWMWDGRKVWVILNNYTYTGAMVHGKTQGLYVAGKGRRMMPKSRWYIAEGAHQAIVTKEEYEKAQTAIIRNSGQKAIPRDRGFSLKGKVVCGSCGLSMAYEEKQCPTLICAHGVSSGSMSRCSRTRYDAKQIEGMVLQTLKQQLKRLESLLPQISANTRPGLRKTEEELAHLDRQLAELRKERVCQYEAYAVGAMSCAAYMEEKQALSREITRARAQKARLMETRQDGEKLLRQMEELGKQAKIVEAQDKMTRELAERFVSRVLIYGREKVEIRFLFDEVEAYLREKGWLCKDGLLFSF